MIRKRFLRRVTIRERERDRDRQRDREDLKSIEEKMQKYFNSCAIH